MKTTNIKLKNLSCYSELNDIYFFNTFGMKISISTFESFYLCLTNKQLKNGILDTLKKVEFHLYKRFDSISIYNLNKVKSYLKNNIDNSISEIIDFRLFISSNEVVKNHIDFEHIKFYLTNSFECFVHVIVISKDKGSNLLVSIPTNILL